MLKSILFNKLQLKQLSYTALIVKQLQSSGRDNGERKKLKMKKINN
jgi:hypothetical protein